jgi:hypothetical protein
MGGLTTNENILQVHAEKFNFESEKWEPFAYAGFDYPFTTGCTAITSLPVFAEKKDLLLFGGTNTQDLAKLVQPVRISQKNKEF